MILNALKYIRSKGEAKEWVIEGRNEDRVHFGNINLIVGKNAVGKSRTLAVIREIANLLSGSKTIQDMPYDNAGYELEFKDGGNLYEYIFAYTNDKVTDEKLFINGELRLDRSKGRLYSTAFDDLVPFLFDENNLTTKGYDAQMHPFIEKLVVWGRSLHNSAFTNQLEKNYQVKDLSELNSDLYAQKLEPVALLQTFWQGKLRFGKTYIDKIKKGMEVMGYPIETIDILEGKGGYSLHVKEDELDDVTSQLEMSQGMFRALSFIVLLNFVMLSEISVCILVDDLGEGLDFERSKTLIDMIVEDLDNTSIQVFITTNDRYIMNKLPLQYWTVLRRYPNKTLFYNYFNSKEIFDDFKYTGLSNFDFLASDFYVDGFEEE
ncbi:ATP-binding protein [Dysgonomonas sp. 216]|uniref:AAA family ATPase n=1 Tax=Dysgonomonas sp. 216 TaxID=2302934 RepID=UPI0013D74681|nr:AAA family ATPase [Dysgonomonas sp. 216]NDW19566.1 ATP-binding protein [Dysgonomonas sp. 216]